MNRLEELRITKKGENGRPWSKARLVRTFEENGFIIDRNKLDRLEGGQLPDEYVLNAYSKVFGVSKEYLSGFTKNKTFDEDYEMVSRLTGLSDESIKLLKESRDSEDYNQKHIIHTVDFLLSNETNAELLINIYHYLFGNYEMEKSVLFDKYHIVENSLSIKNNPKVLIEHLIISNLHTLSNTIKSNSKLYGNYGKTIYSKELLIELKNQALERARTLFTKEANTECEFAILNQKAILDKDINIMSQVSDTYKELNQLKSEEGKLYQNLVLIAEWLDVIYDISRDEIFEEWQAIYKDINMKYALRYSPFTEEEINTFYKQRERKEND